MTLLQTKRSCFIFGLWLGIILGWMVYRLGYAYGKLP